MKNILNLLAIQTNLYFLIGIFSILERRAILFNTTGRASFTDTGAGSGSEYSSFAIKSYFTGLSEEATSSSCDGT